MVIDMEMMRSEIMEGMQSVLTKEQMFMLGNVLCKVFVNYNVQRIEEWHNDISPNGFI